MSEDAKWVARIVLSSINAGALAAFFVLTGDLAWLIVPALNALLIAFSVVLREAVHCDRVIRRARKAWKATGSDLNVVIQYRGGSYPLGERR